MIMKLSFVLIIHFVGTFIQLQINFGIHFILYYDVINQCKCKKKTDTVLPRYWHQFHDGHSWIPGNERRDQPDAWD